MEATDNPDFLMRIVSLLPSATDIVVSLGASDQLVGVSHSCGPRWEHLPSLTRTWVDTAASSQDIHVQVATAQSALYELDVAELEALAPDVVISQSLCDVCAVPSGDVEAAVETVSSQPRLVDLRPFRLNDMPACFMDVARAIGREQAGAELVAKWHTVLASYEGRFAGRDVRIAFLDWMEPPFAAGHWVPDMIELLGCTSVLCTPGTPSHEISWEAVRESRADLIVAACCGFTRDRATLDSIPSDLDVTILDGDELFSRPSPRLLDGIVALAATIQLHLDRPGQRATEPGTSSRERSGKGLPPLS